MAFAEVRLLTISSVRAIPCIWIIFHEKNERLYSRKQRREDETIHTCTSQVYTFKHKNRYKLDQLNFWHAKKGLTLIIELSPTNVYIVSRFETRLYNPQLQLYKNSIQVLKRFVWSIECKWTSALRWFIEENSKICFIYNLELYTIKYQSNGNPIPWVKQHFVI